MSVETPTRRRRGGRAALAAALLAGLCLAAAARAVPPVGPLPPAPDQPWAPPPEERAAPQPIVYREIPPALKAMGPVLTLPEVIDLALRNSPLTRRTWEAARSAAAEEGSRRSQYYPQVSLDASLTRTHQAAVGGQFTFQLSSYGPGLDVSYLLWDFGGRRGDVEEARQALLAADWSHNQAIQTVVLNVEAAYIDYLDAKALRAADEASVSEAETALQAAEDRHRAGVATIADVLQAKTRLAQARLDLEQVSGAIQSTRGSLATAMGLPASIPVEAGELPAEIPPDASAQKIEEALSKALADRPDLAAARSRGKAAEAHVGKVRADGLPTVSIGASANRVYYHDSPADHSDNYSASLTISYPLFTGFQNHYDLEEAKADAETARAEADTLAQQVQLQVWTSYYALQTAGERVKTSHDLLASAGESADVAQGRYKAGVGGILDLLAAQSALASARAQEVQARSDWFLALAQLAYDTGVLGTTPPAIPSTPNREEESHGQP